MKKYRVQLGYQIFHVAWVEVDATSEDDAYDVAMRMAEQPLEYEPDRYDEGSDLQVLQCEEIEDEEAWAEYDCE